MSVAGGPHRPTVPAEAVGGVPWRWDEEREVYRPDLPFRTSISVVLYDEVGTYGHVASSIFRAGWAAMDVGCGLGIQGYYGPDGAMHAVADRVRQRVRYALTVAQKDFAAAVLSADRLGMNTATEGAGRWAQQRDYMARVLESAPRTCEQDCEGMARACGACVANEVRRLLEAWE